MLSGSIVALATPFNPDGSVNFEQMGEWIEFQIANGTDGILVLGTTGESSTMSHEEDDAVCEYTMKKVAGRVKVIAGSGSNSTETQMMKSKRYSDLGVDALLCIAPYYNKANAEGMYLHFATVADAVSAPIILYNVPGRTGCSIPPEVVGRLSKHPNIIGIKEASGDLGYAMKIAKYLNDDFVMFSGNDDIVVPLMSIGAKGVISVWANIMPKECSELVHKYLDGKHEDAAQMQIKYLPIINALFMEVNPIPVKEAMNLMGMNAGGFRLPLYPMTDAHREELAKVMKETGIL
ncbi:MAG: 4-hydroxy-tetrahydrodipicolinate synthase [Firmicutes bacterium]|nr:4-hydroxy-tetrahydrodipicolinate synthase [Bacillota bacterium]